MQKITLQIPLNKQLKDDAEKAAFEQGFSSLQELLRVFMTKFASKSINLSFDSSAVNLSKKSEKRYLRIMEDFKKGKNITQVSSVKELMEHLHKP